MAYLGHFLRKQPKCLCNLSLSLTRVSSQHFNRLFSSNTVESTGDDSPLFQDASIQEKEVKLTEWRTFEELFRKSPFVSLGKPEGKVVIGTIKKVVENSLYIDFGWKFLCVCPRPSEGSGSYVPGREVRIAIKELELATKFLGSDVEVTLNEADCILLGLHSVKRAMSAPESASTDEVPQTSDTTVPEGGRNLEPNQALFADEAKSIRDDETSGKDEK